MKKTLLVLSALLLISGCKAANQPGATFASEELDEQTGTSSDHSTKSRFKSGGYLDSSSELPPADTCQEAGAECGIYYNSVGKKLKCGSCEDGFLCENNRCVDPCNPDPCTAEGSICTITTGGYFCRCEPGYEFNDDGVCERLETVTIRLMSANTTTTNKQTYAGPGIRIFMALKPDIVMIQEFSYDKAYDHEYHFASVDDFVASVFGPEFSYHRGSASNSQIPNGIISRYPIKESGTWADNYVDNRNFEWARIDIPGDKDLWVISVHLLTTTSRQPAEATALVKYIKQNIPEGDYVAIGGDFNTSSRTAPCLTTLDQVVVVKAKKYPVDQSGRQGTNLARKKPYDGVYVNTPLHEMETPVVIGENSFPNGLVFDSRSFRPLSDVTPVKGNDSSSGQMQHMPVIRDFKIW